MLMKKVNILGTEYTITIASRVEDTFLEKCDGYCDKTSKRIVVTSKSDDCELDCFEDYQKQCIRHEIVHAFLFESGLHANFKHDEWGHEETMVDWIAVQFPKMLKVFKEADCL